MTVNKRRAHILGVSLVATFAVVRAFLYLRPDTDLNVGAYNIHHLFSGVVLLAACGIALVISETRSRLSEAATAGFGVGLSLALDEWVYLVATDGSNASYLLPVSWIGGSLMVALAAAYVWLLTVLCDGIPHEHAGNR